VRTVEYYTLEELGDIIKKEISKLRPHEEEENETSLPKEPIVFTTPTPQIKAPLQNNVFNKKDQISHPEVKSNKVITALETRSKVMPPLLIIAPTLVCAFGSVIGLAGYIYYAKQKEYRSAW